MKRMSQVRLALWAAAASPAGFILVLGIAAELQRQPVRWRPDNSSPACELGQHLRVLIIPQSSHIALIRLASTMFSAALPHYLQAHDMQSSRRTSLQCCMAAHVSIVHLMPAEQSAARVGPRCQRGGSTNPWVRAAQAELQGEDDDDFSDLEDFVVCKEGRDYRSLFASHFRYRVRFTDGQAPG